MTKFHKRFRDGYSLTDERATQLAREWKNFQARCRRAGKRAQLNYHGTGKFSFDAFPVQS